MDIHSTSGYLTRKLTHIVLFARVLSPRAHIVVGWIATERVIGLYIRVSLVYLSTHPRPTKTRKPGMSILRVMDWYMHRCMYICIGVEETKKDINTILLQTFNFQNRQCCWIKTGNPAVKIPKHDRINVSYVVSDCTFNPWIWDIYPRD